MNNIIGVITNLRTGKVVDIPLMPVSKFNLNLVKEKNWAIGIDQSTSCTGLCLRDIEGEFMILLDLKRDKSLRTGDYYRDLKYLIKRLITDQQINYLIYERPAPKDMYASRVLHELKGHLEDWIYEFPELEYTVVECLYPQTWKSFVVDKSKGKGRTKQKSAIAEDLCELFPLLMDYKIKYPFSDYDSFDACGILTGYFDYAFDDDGNEKIHGVIEKTHVSLVGYHWCKKADLDNALDFFEGADKIFKPKKLSISENKNLHENVRMASSNYACIYTELPRKMIEQFMWKYGIDPDDQSMCMLMFVLRKSEFTPNEREVFKKYVPWNEEVTN